MLTLKGRCILVKGRKRFFLINSKRMNFLASALGSLSNYSLPYTLGEKIQEANCENSQQNIIWNIYDGVSKQDNKIKVSVFEFDLKNPKNYNYIPLAKNFLRTIKSFRVPGILRCLDTVENDSYIYIFTERVEPLSHYFKSLKDRNPNFELSHDTLYLELYVISNAIKFLNVEGKSVHGNIDVSSIFVTETGEWRLGGLELTTGIQNDPEDCIFKYSSQFFNFADILPSEVRNNGISYYKDYPQKITKLDSYKFAGLIYCIFNGIYDINEISKSFPSLNNVSRIPKKLQQLYKKLVADNISMRITMETFFQDANRTLFYNIDLIQVFKELDELSFKANTEKLEFMKLIDSVKSVTPSGFLEYRIIPEVINLFKTSATPSNYQQDSTSAASYLYYILAFSENLLKNDTDDDFFKGNIGPVIIQAFHLPDRAIRATLLTSLPKYVNKLNKYDVADKIFTDLLTGFSDTNPVIREETLKAVLHIHDKLSDRQLNNELLRYLAKLQNDEKPEIRTNTVVCLCRIAKNLNSNSRTNVLITAYGKALKDKFAPTKYAALLAFEQCIEFFSAEICCSKILSVLAPSLLDKSSKVRLEAGRVFELYMGKIMEEASKLPTTIDGDEEQEHMMTNSELMGHDNGEGSFASMGISFALGVVSKVGGGSLEPSKLMNNSTESFSLPVSSNDSLRKKNVHVLGHTKPTKQMKQNFVTDIDRNAIKSFGATHGELETSIWGDDEEIDLDDENGDGGWGNEDVWDVEEQSALGAAPRKAEPTKAEPTKVKHSNTSSNKGLLLGKKNSHILLKKKINETEKKMSKLNLNFEDEEIAEGWGDEW